MLFNKVYEASYFGLPDAWFQHLVVDIKGRMATVVFVKVSTEHKGYFRMLLRTLEEQGYNVAVYAPVPRTKGIITRLGFKESAIENTLWVKPR
jgi:hypothetical protein